MGAMIFAQQKKAPNSVAKTQHHPRGVVYGIMDTTSICSTVRGWEGWLTWGWGQCSCTVILPPQHPGTDTTTTTPRQLYYHLSTCALILPPQIYMYSHYHHMCNHTRTCACDGSDDILCTVKASRLAALCRLHRQHGCTKHTLLRHVLLLLV